MSVLMIATVSLECKNLFAYSENNPVTGKDSSGAVVETVFDVITLAGSIVDVCCNPTDPLAWVGVAGDIVDLVPFVTGVGEGIKGIRAVAKAADDVHDAGKVADSVTDTSKVISKTNTNSVPNPNGKKGGVAHQSTIATIPSSKIGGEMRYEVKFDTPIGEKNYRYADAVEFFNGEITSIHQVGKVNKNGLPVIRESQAIADIMAAPDYNGAPIYFWPYNSNSGPIIYNY